MKLSTVLPEVIQLAEATREYWSRELPKRYPSYPVVPVDDDGLPRPEEEEKLRRLLNELPADEVYKLILMMYLGRGDFDASNLDAQLRVVKKTFPRYEWAVSQMLSKAPLGEYLEDGWAELKKRKVDVDAPTFLPNRENPTASSAI